MYMISFVFFELYCISERFCSWFDHWLEYENYITRARYCIHFVIFGLIEIIDKQCSSFFQRLSMIDERNFPFMLQCLVS